MTKSVQHHEGSHMYVFIQYFVGQHKYKFQFNSQGYTLVV